MEKHINLLNKLAWSFHTTTGIDFDDLLQEAKVAYLQAMVSYDPKKGGISTHLWSCVRNHLTNYLRVHTMQTGHLHFVDEMFDTPKSPALFFEGLSKDAYTIAKIILNKSSRYVVMELHQIKEEVSQRLKKFGWSEIRIESAYKELRIYCTN